MDLTNLDSGQTLLVIVGAVMLLFGMFAAALTAILWPPPRRGQDTGDAHAAEDDAKRKRDAA